MNRYSMLIVSLGLLPFNVNASWYGAVNLGVNAVTVGKNLSYPLGDPLPTSQRFRSGYTNFHGQLAAGYRFLLANHIGLNLEGNADLFTGKAKHSINNWFFFESVQTEEKLKYGFSLFALPEYCYSEQVRFFAGPGVSRSKFAIASENTAGNVGVTGGFNEWLTGWSLKAGVANQLTANTEILFSYQYTRYNNASWSNIEPLSGESLRGRYKPEANLFMLGIKMKVPEPGMGQAK